MHYSDSISWLPSAASQQPGQHLHSVHLVPGTALSSAGTAKHTDACCIPEALPSVCLTQQLWLLLMRD